jgi:hypothetical protein
LWYWDLNSGPTPLATLPAPFCDFCFFCPEIGSHELFAWASFKSWSSWSLAPEQPGLQAWATCA